MNLIKNTFAWFVAKPLRWATLLLALLAVVVGLIVLKLTAPKAESEEKVALTVAIEKVQTSNLPQLIDANGDVKAWEEAVIAAQTSGLRISKVFKDVGDTVKKDEVLAEFSAESVNARVKAQQASVTEAKALLAQAVADMKGADRLKAAGAISQQKYLQLQVARTSAQARLDVARAQLTVENIGSSQTKLRAPDSGVISSKTVVTGLVPAPGQELFKLVRQGRIEWHAQVTAEQLGQLQAGMAAQVLSLDGQVLKGTVRSVSPTLDEKTRNGTVIVSIPSDEGLRAGMFAKGSIMLGEGNALTVPESAVVQRDGFGYVFVVDSSNIAKRIQVETGRRENGRIEVKSGLSEAQSVVVKGAGFLKDGDKVGIGANDGTTAKPAAKPVTE